MAAKKRPAEFTRTVVPALPEEIQQQNKAKTITSSTAQELAKLRADLAQAQAQLAQANQVLAKIEQHHQPAPKTRPTLVKPAAAPRTGTKTATTKREEGDDRQFVVELPPEPEYTVPSDIKKVMDKAKRQPKKLSIDFADHPELADRPKVDAGKQLVNPAALACGSYVHGEGDLDESTRPAVPTQTAILMDDGGGVFTSVHQGVVFNMSSYSAAGVGSVPRRLAAFMIDLSLTVLISFIFMSSAQLKFWFGFAHDLAKAFGEFLSGPIFHIGVVIESVTSGRTQELTLSFNKLISVLQTNLSQIDLSGLLILAIVWAATTIPPIYFWQSTLGQRILHLRIMHAQQIRLSLMGVILRQMVFLPLSMASVIGLLMSFTGSHRCWHDHLSGCKVATHI